MRLAQYQVSILLFFIVIINSHFEIIIIYMQSQAFPQQSKLTGCTLADISSVLPDPNVQQLFVNQLTSLPKLSYSIYIAYHKIYLIIQLKKYLQATNDPSVAKDQKEQNKKIDIESKYTIKINRRFPLKSSVKVHLVESNIQPKISDNRDLFHAMMGIAYEHPIPLKDITDKLVQLDQKLAKINENFMELQKIGRFTLGQKFYYRQLTQMYSSLILFKDHYNRKKNIYIGLTQTHILCFHELDTKQQMKRRYSGQLRNTESTSHQRQASELQKSQETQNELQLISCAQLQCIDTIFYRQNEKQLRIIFKKYQSIKLYHEFQQIKRTYKFIHPELFIRGILKSITRFQHTQINFEPHRREIRKQKDNRPNVSQSITKHREIQRVNFCIEEAQKHLAELKKDSNTKDRKMHLQQIQKYYRKIIEYYSARTNPYYLIYVNKLNNLYARYFMKEKEKRPQEVG